jgi:probable HAF family extracellular repeat protein
MMRRATLLLLAIPLLASGQQYTVTDLGSLSSNPSGAAYGLSADGKIVGVSTNAAGDRAAFVYVGGVMTELSVLPGDRYGEAYSINSSGRACGTSQAFNNTGSHAVSWSTGSVTNILPPSFSYGEGNAIDENGVVAGTGRIVAGSYPYYHAFTYLNGQVTMLQELNGASSSMAMSFSTDGLIAGASGDETPRSRAVQAVYWQSGAIHSIGSFGSRTVTRATGINSHGWIVGFGTTDYDYYLDQLNMRPFIYRAGVMEAMPLAGNYGQIPKGINDFGVVVGTYDFDEETGTPNRGFIYRDGQSTRLTSLVDPSWIVFEANAINNSGLIVGTAGRDGPFGARRPVLLTPVPEPASLACVGVLCLLVRRRRLDRG